MGLYQICPHVRQGALIEQAIVRNEIGEALYLLALCGDCCADGEGATKASSHQVLNTPLVSGPEGPSVVDLLLRFPGLSSYRCFWDRGEGRWCVEYEGGAYDLQDFRAWLLHERSPPFFGELVRALLAHGGTRVVPQIERDIGELLRRGRILAPGRRQRLLMRRGAPNACHSNVAQLWLADREHLRIAVGWALSADGWWRQHTWALHVEGAIVETTVRRRRYFGIELSKEESARFAEANPG